MNKASGVTRYLPGQLERAQLMRLDSAAILKRFFFCEEALIRGQGGWLAAIGPLELKLLVPRHIWEDAQAADALRQRVFELRFPNRLMEVGSDGPVVDLFEHARHAPGPAAYITGLTRVLIPALARAYGTYLEKADDIGDGPTKRFMEVALREKDRQIGELGPHCESLLASAPLERPVAERWAIELAERLAAVGGLGLASPTAPAETWSLAGLTPFSLVQIPARDGRFHHNRFYWPDNVDSGYPYGEGIALQLRSAVSHINEVWAVETAGAILEAFGAQLGWEFVKDAARWVYDESRHTMMGWSRLRSWGFAPEEIPLGSYIYESAAGQDPIYRLAMLHFFESKNIGKKTQRIQAFATYGDAASQHDMDFDWADEGIHAAYGHRWLRQLFAGRRDVATHADTILKRCAELVAITVASATPDEIADIRLVAGRLIEHAHAVALPA